MDLLIQDPKHMGSTRALTRVLFFEAFFGKASFFVPGYDAFCAGIAKNAKSF